ncbi:MAG: hypothetical protein K0S68_590 [Candidatus Saccharibacteria bacterium]|nr:hypothetical protein [Candidatus Saccharibacteria bacterium]
MTYIIQIGTGVVGGALLHQIRAAARPDLVYAGIFDINGGVFDPGGLKDLDAPKSKDVLAADAIAKVKLPFVLVDATGSHSTLPLVKQALARGGAAVTPNKRNLAGAQSDYDELVGSGRMYFETTVGAGLPVIRPLQDLIATGDEVERIEGCVSGTLGYVCSDLQAGRPFSQVVADAKAKGFTEPDPRDDLSGMDVARKVIILARLMGRRLEPEAVTLEGLYPDSLSKLSVDEFMRELPSLDDDYAHRTKEAAAKGQVLRYVATVTPADATVGLKAVDASTEIGQLSGPDNIVVIQTKRYHDNKLVVKGPGAGAEVTAAGVFADILASMRERHD